MKRNVGKIDRLVRVLVAIAVAVLIFSNVVSGTGALILAILGVVVLFTGLSGFCGLYTPFGIDTRKNKE